MTNQELCLRYQYGDRAAGEALIQQNTDLLRLIAESYANQYPQLSLTEDDYFQEECLALLRAAKRYQPQQGDFLPYVKRAAKNAATDAVRAAYYESREVLLEHWEEQDSEDEDGGDMNAPPAFDPMLLSSYQANPERIYLQKELYQSLYAAMNSLPKRENMWVRERYGFEDEEGKEHPVAEMARKYRLSTNRAMRLEDEALEKMRRDMQGKL